MSNIRCSPSSANGVADDVRLFSLAAAAHQLTEPEKDALHTRYAADRRPRESVIGYLLRVGWLRPDAAEWLNAPPARSAADLEGAELFTSRMFDRLTAEVGGTVGGSI